MAMLLKKQYNLVALKVTLATRGSSASVRFELEVTEDHVPRTTWETTLAAGEIGLTLVREARHPDAGVHDFRLPPHVPAAIGGTLRELHYDGAVWLHLVKPYGVLGAIPWEGLLAPIGNPILRLPDALADAAAEIPRTLDVLLCASRPHSKEAFNIPGAVAQMAERIVGSVEERTVRVHIFTDLECTAEISEKLGVSGLLGTHVKIWDPHGANNYRSAKKDAAAARASAFMSPWLLWMLECMGGKSVDVVHFLCHGYLTDCSGALAFAESPVVNQDPQWSRFADGSEIERFLLQLGAWSVAFSSPPGNYSALGLRTLVDEFAQERPGPVLHHECSDDPGFEQLGEAYRFLYAREPRHPGPMPAIALCCQPALVAGPEGVVRKSFSALTAAIEGTGLETMPGWVASAQRFIEQKEFEVKKIKRKAVRLTSQSVESVEGIERGVDEIRQTLERLARKGLL